MQKIGTEGVQGRNGCMWKEIFWELCKQLKFGHTVYAQTWIRSWKWDLQNYRGFQNKNEQSQLDETKRKELIKSFSFFSLSENKRKWRTE